MHQVLVRNQKNTINIPRVPVNEIGVRHRVRGFCSRSIKKESKMSALMLAVSMTDLTTLEGSDTRGKVIQLCAKADRPLSTEMLRSLDGLAGTKMPAIPSVAAVCVYPAWVATAKEALEGSEVRVASVATGFPAGSLPLSVKLADVDFAVGAGADEIDMVLDRGAFLSGHYQKVFDEIVAVKKICGDVHLKVILETGELGSLDQVRLASWLAMEAGADFVKTSTGKISEAASMDVTLVMLQAIYDYYRQTGRKIGMKPAGGIRTAKQAVQYLVMVLETLGPHWMNPELFRFGASSLLNDILRQILRQTTGSYFYQDVLSQE